MLKPFSIVAAFPVCQWTTGPPARPARGLGLASLFEAMWRALNATNPSDIEPAGATSATQEVPVVGTIQSENVAAEPIMGSSQAEPSVGSSQQKPNVPASAAQIPFKFPQSYRCGADRRARIHGGGGMHVDSVVADIATSRRSFLGCAGGCNQRICSFNSLHCPLMSVGTHCVWEATVGARRWGGCPSLVPPRDVLSP